MWGRVLGRKDGKMLSSIVLLFREFSLSPKVSRNHCFRIQGGPLNVTQGEKEQDKPSPF